MRVIAIMNQKGGVGKTTTTANVAHALALAGQRVLVLDMDPQGQLGVGLGVHVNGHGGLDHVLLEGASLCDVIVDAREQLKLAPAGARLAEFEHIVVGGAQRGELLRRALENLGEEVDFALIDAPPSTGLLAVNALIAAEEVLAPVSGDYLGLHGVTRFMELAGRTDKLLGRQTQMWIALTRFNARRRLANDVRDRLIEHFPGHVLATPVHECASLAESPSFGKTIFEYHANGRGAEDYRRLTQDLLERKTL